MRGKEWHMTVDRILISTGPGEVRVAELNDGELIGLTFERLGHKSRVGDIFLGRVEAVIHNLQAAFVDIGLARSGFLALPEARPVNGGPDDAIGDYLKEGDAVVVQVTRDPEEGERREAHHAPGSDRPRPGVHAEAAWHFHLASN